MSAARIPPFLEGGVPPCDDAHPMPGDTAAFETPFAPVDPRDEFLAVASHELRGPAYSLRMTIEALVRTLTETSADLPSPAAALLRNAHRQTDSLVRLTEALLDVARMRSGAFVLERERVDLVELAKDVIARQAMESKPSSVVTVLAPKRVVGWWDAARVEQILTNLVGNAVKYGAGQPVCVGIFREDSFAKIAVADRGIGIPPDRLHRIFEPFERAVPARDYQGFGLGLYVVQQLTRMLGGSITVDSEVGLGSTFTVHLPFGVAS